MGFLDTIKDVVTLVQKADNIDLLKRVLELQTQAFDLFQENQKLKVDVASLSALLDTKKSLTFKSPFYYAEGDPVPLCASCWESGHKVSHMNRIFPTRYDCLVCDKTVMLERNDPPSPIARRRGPFDDPDDHRR